MKIPVGKVILQNDVDPFTVTGVFEDLPERSHMKFDLLYSFETYVNYTSENARTAWQWDGFLNYIQLVPGTDPKAGSQISGICGAQGRGGAGTQFNAGMKYNLQPLTKIHLISNYRGEIKPTGNERATYFLLIIGLFVLVIAWINYINLTTAHSLKRAREVGIRKVLGSYKAQLLRQFLAESTFMNLLAFALGRRIYLHGISIFQQLPGKSHRIHLAGFHALLVRPDRRFPGRHLAFRVLPRNDPFEFPSGDGIKREVFG